MGQYSIDSVRDRIVQEVVGEVVSRLFEPVLCDCSYASRCGAALSP